MKSNNDKAPNTDANIGYADKFDALIEMLENIYILNALSLGASPTDIRSLLKIRTSRVSAINKGLKRGLKHSNIQKF